MDVVRTNIEAIGGSVAISGSPGAGTTVRLQIPLTLAIMPVLLVACGAARYALPEAALVEILRIDASEGLGIESVHGAPVYRRRGELIPLVALADALAGVPTRALPGVAFVVVVALEGKKVGLVVDELHESEEIVVKPLGPLAMVPCFTGATVLGDGRVALIVDVARLVGELGSRGVNHGPVLEAVTTSTPQLLVVRGRTRRYGIPLGDVSRLEQFATAAIEQAGRMEVVQYHGGLMPLVRLGDPLAERATVVVYTGGGRPLGVVVESVVDVYDGAVDLDVATAMPGICGSAVIGGHTTDIVDVAAVVAAGGLFPELS